MNKHTHNKGTKASNKLASRSSVYHRRTDGLNSCGGTAGGGLRLRSTPGAGRRRLRSTARRGRTTNGRLGLGSTTSGGSIPRGRLGLRSATSTRRRLGSTASGRRTTMGRLRLRSTTCTRRRLSTRTTGRSTTGRSTTSRGTSTRGISGRGASGRSIAGGRLRKPTSGRLGRTRLTGLRNTRLTWLSRTTGSSLRRSTTGPRRGTNRDGGRWLRAIALATLVESVVAGAPIPDVLLAGLRCRARLEPAGAIFADVLLVAGVSAALLDLAVVSVTDNYLIMMLASRSSVLALAVRADNLAPTVVSVTYVREPDAVVADKTTLALGTRATGVITTVAAVRDEPLPAVTIDAGLAETHATDTRARLVAEGTHAVLAQRAVCGRDCLDTADDSGTDSSDGGGCEGGGNGACIHTSGARAGDGAGNGSSTRGARTSAGDAANNTSEDGQADLN